MDIAGYLEEIRGLHKSGETTEHSFRPALERLFRSIDDDLTVINEPKQLVDVGAPDFVFARNGVSIGWCEAKDIGKDISKFKASDYSKEQKQRYTKGLPNLIYTNGTDFEFIRNAERIAFITIADFIPTLPAREQNFEALENMLREFASQTPISIGAARPLAGMMAGKAVIIKDLMAKALVKDREAGDDSELNGQYEAFKANLIHDISVGEFADIYAETIAYGLFAARLHDETLDTFSRSEALDLLPKSNPFLRKLFIYIAGPDLDERLRWIVDELCDVFRATDLHEIMKDFGKFTARNDPFLHFYETFLAEYNPKKRKARGVWYTPEPVVNFIVRAVDDVLKKEFGLSDGLADTSKITVDWDTGQTDKKGKAVRIKKDVHRVQILDPATGTGTFLAEVIKQVAGRVKGIAPGQWSTYVENDLIPRIHGFELLMASYAMCHMKLDMMLTELGYKPSGNPPRLGVYLTNSLEEGEKVEQNLFAQWLANEAKEASDIKRQTPIMCVIGNPPYSGESANKGPWIMDLMEAYKKEPGGKEKLKERNPKWINDDYVKFIRLAEHMIAKNGEGILGFITNHGYLDNPTFRGMRWHLLKTFDKIYVLDLHGNTNRNERASDGAADKNVFDIRQGVAIIIAVKKKKSLPTSASIMHGEVRGTRKSKNETLFSADLTKISASKLTLHRHYQMFYPVDHKLLDIYDEGFQIAEFMSVNEKGITTSRDHLAIGFGIKDTRDKLASFVDESKTDSEVRQKFFSGKKKKKNLPLGDTKTWSLSTARTKLARNRSPNLIQPIAYRPFDHRAVIYSGIMLERSREGLMKHIVEQKNICLSFNRGIEEDRLFTDICVFAQMTQLHSLSIKESNNLAPLYLYPDEDSLDQSIRVNFDPKIYAEIAEKAGFLKSSPERGGGSGEADDGGGSQPDTTSGSASPLHHPSGGPPPRTGEDFREATGDARPDEVKVFDYIYGVLHSPDYRETYREFLKIDFPRIPYPKDAKTFAHISEKGEELRRLHLMETQAIGETPYPFDGEAPEDAGEDSIVDKPRFAPLPFRGGVGGGASPPDIARADKPHPNPSPKGEGLRGRVYINGKGDKGQYFEGVPQLAWNFYIGGYQPAQKWLKDRKGRGLSWDDIRHYQKIIKILSETDRIMKEIKLPLD